MENTKRLDHMSITKSNMQLKLKEKKPNEITKSNRHQAVIHLQSRHRLCLYSFLCMYRPGKKQQTQRNVWRGLPQRSNFDNTKNIWLNQFENNYNAYSIGHALCNFSTKSLYFFFFTQDTLPK